MANEIIDIKYYDIFGVNNKYGYIIQTKLNDNESYNAFKVLINIALDNLTDLMGGKIRIGLIEPGMYYKYYGYNKDYPVDYQNVFEGYAPRTVMSKDLNQCARLFPAARLTKFVNLGLLNRYKNSDKDPYLYYLPYDFFITNNLMIKFVPNDVERTYLHTVRYNF